MPKRNVTPDSTVFVASWGWRDGDHCGSVCATTKKKAEALAAQGMREDAHYAWESDFSVPRRDRIYLTLRSALADVAWYGASAFRLADVLSSCHETDDYLDELNNNGYCYLDTAQ